MQSKMEAVRAKVAECVRIAESKYGITMPQVDVRFDLTGRAAGIAGWRPNRTGTPTYYLRFNVTHMSLGGATWEHLLNDTVPHEVAHTVCQRFPTFGRNHDGGWKSVCIALGGNGKTRYSADDAPEAHAKQRPFTYTASSGKTIAVSPRIHAKIQRGASYNYRGYGVINRSSPVTKTSVDTVKVVSKVTANKKAPAPKSSVKVTTRVVDTIGGKVTNASRVRAFIKTGATFKQCVDHGVNVLGQARPLATNYVKANWTVSGRTDAMV